MNIMKKYELLYGVTIFCIIYLTLLPNRIYYSINNNYYSRLLIISLITLLAYYDICIAILLTMCYVVSVYSYDNYELFDIPSNVLPYLILKDGKTKYSNNIINNTKHKSNKNNNCYYECTNSNNVTDDLKITCNAACDIDNKFTKSPKNLVELKNIGSNNPIQTMLNIGCNRINGKEKTTWKNGKCSKD